ncbi:MAG: long-chain fatty acid--CoA ligase [Betaproteobacteria bacterium]|nr:long-chain fatty acid--CoA ligase [Betaproteobacteria bacterium]
MNLANILARSASLSAQRIALVDSDAPGGSLSLTYAELWLRARRIAGGLLARGLKPGDRVALLLPNSREYVESFIGVATAGMVAVPMNIRLLESELLHMLKDSGARLLIAQDALFAGREALVGVPELGVAAMRATGTLAAPKFDYEFLAMADPAEPAARAPEDLASLMYTSGTTGLPKGVMLPHRSWYAVSDTTRRLLGYGEAEVTLHAAPLTHGAGFLLLPTLASAGVNVVVTRFEPARILKLMRDERVTNTFLVPSMIQILLDTPDPEARPAPNSHPDLKTIYYAGSPIDPGTLKGALARFGGVLVQSFGQMESPMFFTLMDRRDHARIADGSAAHLIRSAGCAIPGVKVRIVDDDGRDLPQGEAGEIALQAPQTMLGYWNRPEATAESIRNGWLHTGDVGRFDADGYLYLVDRKKDMIISGGSNVYAREVEEALLGFKGIKEAAVIGLPHPKWGEMVTAVLVSESGQPLDEALLVDYCRNHLPDYRRPKRFAWVATLPRNAYGKVLKRDLRKSMLDAN